METSDLEKLGFKPAPSDYFSHEAFIKTLVASDSLTNCIISEVYFRAGCRNNWHTHGSNQILMVKEGVCYYQEEGKEIQKIPSGGIINVIPGIKHWHGASPEAPMIHIAININTEKGVVNWLEPVTNEEYSK